MKEQFIALGVSPATNEEIFTLPWGQQAPEDAPPGRFPFLSELALMFRNKAVDIPADIACQIPEIIEEDSQVVVETTPCPPDHDISELVWADVQHEVYGHPSQNEFQPMVYTLAR